MKLDIYKILKPFLLLFSLFILSFNQAHAQTAREIDGIVIDSTKLGVPGAGVKLKTDRGDSTVAITDANGKFVFGSVAAAKVTLTITSLGYQGLIKHYTLDVADTKPLVLPPIILKNDTHMLNG